LEDGAVFTVIRSGLMGFAWLAAALVLLCSVLQVARLFLRENWPD